MTKGNPVGWLTAKEAAHAVNVAEGREVLTLDTLKNWNRLGVVPARKVGEGRAWLYSCDDVSTLRVAVRLRHLGASQQHVTAAIRFLRPAIADAYPRARHRDRTADSQRWLCMDDRGCAAVIPGAHLADVEGYGLKAVSYRVNLDTCWRGTSAVMKKVRQQRGADVWDGRRYVTANDLRTGASVA